MVQFGRAKDEFFIRFIGAKEDDDVESARELLNGIENLPAADREELSDLYMEIEDYVRDMDELESERDYDEAC